MSRAFKVEGEAPAEPPRNAAFGLARLTGRFALQLGTCALLAIGGCASSPSGQTVVELWAMGREGEMVQRLVPAFEERHPDVRVRVQQIPWSAAHEKLLTAYVGEAMPDVFQLGNTWIPELAALGALEPLDPWLERAHAAVPLGDYFAGILDTNRLGGQLHALPWYVDTRLLFYRADLLHAAGYATPPATWTGWRDALQRVQERLGPRRHGIVLPITEWQLPIILALQAGAPLLRGNGEHADFRSPPVRAAFDFYLSFFQRGLTPANTQTANLYRDFVNGDFACFVSGPWSIGELRARAPADFADRWRTAPLPDLGDEGIGVSLAGGASLAMFAASPRKEAAWRWMAFLSQPEQQSEFFQLTGDLPARTSAWESGPIATDPVIDAFRRQLGHVRATPKVPEWERIASKVSQHIESLARDTTSIDASLTALDAEVDAILAKRRWMLRRQATRADAGAGA
jgi:multiple sugar transport system substrate-binding protein